MSVQATQKAAVLQWGQLASAAAHKHSIPVSWILATIDMESSGKPEAVSHSGFRGLMQVGKAVSGDWSERAGQANPWPAVHNPSLNIEIGSWFLKWCSRFVSKWCSPSNLDHSRWVRACYGWGPGNLRRTVEDATTQLGKSPTIDDLARAYPDAGKGYVRPWTAKWPRTVAAYGGITSFPKPPAAAGPGSTASLALVGLLALGGALALIGIGAWYALA